MEASLYFFCNWETETGSLFVNFSVTGRHNGGFVVTSSVAGRQTGSFFVTSSVTGVQTGSFFVTSATGGWTEKFLSLLLLL